MRAPPTAELLDAWDRGRRLGPVARSLLLLEAAVDAEPRPVADWPLGRRDGALLALRGLLFGPRLSALTDCPRCGDRLELDLDAEALRAPGAGAGAGAEPDALTVECGADRYRLRVRPVRSSDLLAVADRPEAGALLALCVVDAERDGVPVAAEGLPDEVVAAVEERLAALDPQVDVTLSLACDGCGNRWAARFDIGSYLWREVDAWASRLLGEVHLLASAYNWSEPEILKLSDHRRRIYLDYVLG